MNEIIKLILQKYKKTIYKLYIKYYLNIYIYNI